MRRDCTPRPSIEYPGCWELPLNDGLFAIVDDADVDRATERNWGHHKTRNNIYARSNAGKKFKTLLLHRYIMQIPGRVDHINGNGLDCRRCNMRPATHAQNIMNSGIRSNNKSGFKGVFWNSQKRKWNAKIMLNYRNIHCGFFDDVIEAAKAYDTAARIYHGEFAKLNFPD